MDRENQGDARKVLWSYMYGSQPTIPKIGRASSNKDKMGHLWDVHRVFHIFFKHEAHEARLQRDSQPQGSAPRVPRPPSPAVKALDVGTSGDLGWRNLWNQALFDVLNMFECYGEVMIVVTCCYCFNCCFITCVTSRRLLQREDVCRVL